MMGIYMSLSFARSWGAVRRGRVSARARQGAMGCWYGVTDDDDFRAQTCTA